MRGLGFYRGLFLVAAAYDALLGLAFVLFHVPIYAHFGMTLPHHPGYVQLPALFIAIMGVADGLVARDPVRNRDLVLIRVLMKVAYSGLCFWYVGQGGLSSVWLTLAVGNLVFIVPYTAFLVAVRAHAAR
jgi:hypothetical protein